MLKCLYCQKEFHHLGSHIYHKHKVRTREYKMEFGLPLNTPLTTPEIQKKQKEANARNWNEVVQKNLIAKGEKNRFQKGHSKTKYSYRSPYALKKAIATIKEVNKNRTPEQCPVCHIIFDQLDSHLYNMHKLLRVI